MNATTTVKTGRCLCCKTRQAQPSSHSVVQLCTGCAYTLCPGSDVERYRLLIADYGYATR